MIDAAYISEGFLYVEHNGVIEVYATESEYFQWLQYCQPLDEYKRDDYDYYSIMIDFYTYEYFQLFIKYMEGRCVEHWRHECEHCTITFKLNKND